MKPLQFFTLLSFLCFGFISAFAQPPNDNPSNATLITLGINSCSAILSGNTQNATASSLPIEECVAEGSKDVWYKFIPQTFGVVNIRFTSADLLYLRACLYYPNGGKVELNDPAPDPGSLHFQLLVNKDDTYLIRISDKDLVDFSSFTICAFLTDNDEFANAKTIKVGGYSTGSCPQIEVIGTTKNATQSISTPLPACMPNNASNYNDVWYKFIAPAKGNIHVNTAYTDGDREITYHLTVSVYEEDLTQVKCNTSVSNNYIVVNSPAVGTVYYVRVFAPINNPEKFSGFRICAIIHSPRENDSINGAIQIPITDYQCEENPEVWNTTAATPSSVEYPICDKENAGPDGADDDIWGTFEAERNGTIKVQLTHNPYYNSNSSGVVLQFFSIDASGNFHQESCGFYDSNPEFIFQVTKNKKFYIRAFTPENSPVHFTSLSLCAYYVRPLNDEITGAIDVPVSENNSCNGVNSTTFDASKSLEGCDGSNSDDDVWFKFTATAVDQYIKVSPAETLGINNVVFEVFSVNSGNLVSMACVNQIGSDEPEEVALAHFTMGDTYFIRVFSHSDDIAKSGNFNICIAPSKPTKINLLLNPSFESPAQQIPGDLLYGKNDILNWEFNESAFLVKEFEDGQVYGGGPDTAHHGKQFLHIEANEGTCDQVFTLDAPATIEFGAWFSGRVFPLEDDFYGEAYLIANDVANYPPGTRVAETPRLSNQSFTSNKVWKMTLDTVTLPAGDYTFRVQMRYTANCDAPFIQIYKQHPPGAILWTGAVDNTFENPDNWLGGVVPGDDSAVVFDGKGLNNKKVVVTGTNTLKYLFVRNVEFNQERGRLTTK